MLATNLKTKPNQSEKQDSAHWSKAWLLRVFSVPGANSLPSQVDTLPYRGGKTLWKPHSWL